ncbi:calponin homology domain-containing protein, partial [Pavlovales sp. CCMP2436]
VVLCELANAILPGSIARIERVTLAPFPQRENIERFLQAVRALGVQEHETFETGDLFNGTNLRQVSVCLGALG